MTKHSMRKATASITYMGEDLATSLESKTDKFTYNDPESGSSDDCSLTICDPDEKWINGYFPNLGDTITAKITVFDWRNSNDTRILNCGEFVMDDPGFSGPPLKVSLKAVSKPADGAFSSQERTQTWENVTVQNMAGEIALRSGLALQYTAPDIKIESLEQNGQTDSDFIKKTCEEYGLSLKVYSKRLVIFDRESYKKMPAVVNISKDEIISWNFKTSLAGTYTGGKMSYTDPDSEEDIEAKVGSEQRMLSVSGKADSRSDAEKKIKAQVNKANEEQTTLSVTVPGNPDLVSSQCVNIIGLGKADGKYYIKKVTHSVGGGYKTSLDLSKVVASI